MNHRHLRHRIYYPPKGKDGEVEFQGAEGFSVSATARIRHIQYQGCGKRRGEALDGLLKDLEARGILCELIIKQWGGE